MNAEKYPLLSQIASPADLRLMKEEEMAPLAEEIRAFLVENVSKTGGHLASNLGVVELTLALHRVFHTPSDKLIFDVGHQTYVHKMLTGRIDRFDTLRTPGGLSGFTTPAESEYDPAVTGHSSDSVSLALGFAEQNRLSGSDAVTVAVVGDGAFTGGMIHEALNNCHKGLCLVIVLNENRMSISKNRGAFAAYLSRVRVSAKYQKSKSKVKKILHFIPIIGPILSFCISHTKNLIRKIIHPLNYFEDLGLGYIGPVNGNDYKEVEKAFAHARNCTDPVIVHVSTKKGKGYPPAEAQPDVYHSITPQKAEGVKFHEAFSEELVTLAEADSAVVAVTAAMGVGTGLSEFAEKYPDRYFDVGIAEEHAVTFAAGLAAAGAKPYAVIYSTFLQRAYDSILHDVAISHLPVHFIVDRAGLAPSDGVTHHGVYDTAFLSGIPGVEIYAPAGLSALRAVLTRTKDASGPVAVRYPNTAEPEEVLSRFAKVSDAPIYADYDVENPPKCLFVTYGHYVGRVYAAEAELRQSGLSVGTLLIEKLSPASELSEAVAPYLRGAETVIFAEEAVRAHGVFEGLAASLAQAGKISFRFEIAAICDPTAVPAAAVDLYEFHGIGEKSLARLMKSLSSNDKS